MPVAGMRLSRMRKSVKAAARSIEEVALSGQEARVAVMVTLTYADVDGWGRRHVSDYLQHVRMWSARRGFEIPYVWVAELQARGAVHYHVVFWMPTDQWLPSADRRGWWAHGMSNTIRARKPMSYLLKYATKGDASEFPRGLRLYGYGGLSSEGRAVRYWLCLPGWLIRKARVFQRITRLPGGFWVQENTGELWRGAWEFVRLDRDAQCVVFRPRSEPPTWSVRCAFSGDAPGRGDLNELGAI